MQTGTGGPDLAASFPQLFRPGPGNNGQAAFGGHHRPRLPAMDQAANPAEGLKRTLDRILHTATDAQRKPLPAERRRKVFLCKSPSSSLDRLVWFIRSKKVHTTQSWTVWMTQPENERAALLNSEPVGLLLALAPLVPASPFGREIREWPKSHFTIQERVLALASPLCIDLSLPDGASESALARWIEEAAVVFCQQTMALAKREWLRHDRLAPATVFVLSDRTCGAVRLLWPLMCCHRRAASKLLLPALKTLRRSLCGTWPHATAVFMDPEAGSAPIYGSSIVRSREQQRADLTQLFFGVWRDGVLSIGVEAAAMALDGISVDLGPLGAHTIRGGRPRSLDCVLPVLCSPNPTGRPVVRLQGEDAETVLGFEPLVPLARGDLPDRLVGTAMESVAAEYESSDERERKALSVLRSVHLILNLLSPAIAEDPAKVMEIGNNVASATLRSSDGYAVWQDWLRRCCPHSSLSNDELQLRWQSYTLTSSGLNDLVFLLRQDSSEKHAHYHALRVADVRGEPSDDATRAMAFRRQLGDSTLHDVALFVQEAIRDVVVCAYSGNGKDPAEWRVYSTTRHRWVTDKSGGTVKRMCRDIIMAYVRWLSRNPGAAGTGGPGGAGMGTDTAGGAGGQQGQGHGGPGHGRGRRDGPSPYEVLMAITNNPRDLGAVVQIMATELEHPEFDQLLDQKDHLLPFENGVLDMQVRMIRPGRPADLCSKGPNYPWIDRGPSDVVLQDTEQKLIAMFPDKNILRFFTQIGASLLVKGNPHKKMVIGTGNTGGGKSLVNSMLQFAFGKAACVIPVSFLCTEDTDAGRATDYLARSHGCNVALASESDRSKQKLMGAKIKRIVTPRDGIPTRMLFGATFTMIIKWVLFMWCNSVPAISNLEDAIVLRLIFLRFESIFTDEKCVPVSTSEQLKRGTFRMQTDFAHMELENTAQAMMNIFFATYCRFNMQRPSYTLAIPERISLDSESYFRTITTFRRWVESYVRPTTWSGAIVSPADDEALRVMGQLSQELHAAWLQWRQRDTAQSCSEEEAQMVIGSPTWARRICDYLRGLMPNHANKVWPPREAPVVTSNQIMMAYRAYLSALGSACGGQDGTNGGQDGNNGGDRKKRSTATSGLDSLDPMTSRRIINEVLRRDEISEMVYLGYTILGTDASIRAMGMLPSVQKVAQAAARCAQMHLQKKGWFPPHVANLTVEEIVTAQVSCSISEMAGGSMGMARGLAVPADAADSAAPTSTVVADPTSASFYLPHGDADYDVAFVSTLRRADLPVSELRAFVDSPTDFAKRLWKVVTEGSWRRSAGSNSALNGKAYGTAVQRSWTEKVASPQDAATLLALLDLGSDVMQTTAKQSGRVDAFEYGFSDTSKYPALPRSEEGAELGSSSAFRRTGARSAAANADISTTAPHPTEIIPEQTRDCLREPQPHLCLFYQPEERRDRLAQLADDSTLIGILLAAGLKEEEAQQTAECIADEPRSRTPELGLPAELPPNPLALFSAIQFQRKQNSAGAAASDKEKDNGSSRKRDRDQEQEQEPDRPMSPDKRPRQSSEQAQDLARMLAESIDQVDGENDEEREATPAQGSRVGTYSQASHDEFGASDVDAFFPLDDNHFSP